MCEAVGETSDTAADSDEGLSNAIAVGSQSGTQVEYRFTVTGRIESRSDDRDGTGDTASGTVADSVDEYAFSGTFEAFRYSGPVEIAINNRRIYED
jgi:hypothetical protein